MPLSFAAVETAFRDVHLVGPERYGAFRSRLKHMQRLGFPPGINVGTGKPAAYGGQQIFLLGLALEFLQLGLTPERALNAIRSDPLPLIVAGRFALAGLNSDPPTYNTFLHCDPGGLGGLTAEGNDDTAADTLWYSGKADLTELVANWSSLMPRLAIINLSVMIARIYSSLSEQKEEFGETFERELQSWFDTDPENRERGVT